MASSGPKISVVIPVGPQESAGPKLYSQILSEKLMEGDEILWVSPKEPKLLEPSRQLHWVPTEKDQAHRAHQLNFGAKRAKGDLIWFLHADSEIQKGSLDRLRKVAASAKRPTVWFFDLKFRKDGPAWVRLNEWGARFRSRALKIPFGDQGLALMRSDFEKSGGYPEIKGPGEDHFFIWRVRALGFCVSPIGLPLWTSARKYQEQGWLRTTVRYLTLTAAQAIPEWIKIQKGRNLNQIWRK